MTIHKTHSSSRKFWNEAHFIVNRNKFSCTNLRWPQSRRAAVTADGNIRGINDLKTISDSGGSVNQRSATRAKETPPSPVRPSACPARSRDGWIHGWMTSTTTEGEGGGNAEQPKPVALQAGK